MKTAAEIREDLEALETELRKKMKRLGANECVRRTGGNQPDISAWINSNRSWTYNKILRMAEKLGL